MSSYIAGPLSARRWPPTKPAWSAEKKTAVLSRKLQLVDCGEDAADLLVDQRHIAPVHRHQLLPRLPGVGVKSPVVMVPALHRGLPSKVSSMLGLRSTVPDRTGRHRPAASSRAGAARKSQSAGKTAAPSRHARGHTGAAARWSARPKSGVGALDWPFVDAADGDGRLAIGKGARISSRTLQCGRPWCSRWPHRQCRLGASHPGR